MPERIYLANLGVLGTAGLTGLLRFRANQASETTFALRPVDEQSSGARGEYGLSQKHRHNLRVFLRREAPVLLDERISYLSVVRGQVAALWHRAATLAILFLRVGVRSSLLVVSC